MPRCSVEFGGQPAGTWEAVPWCVKLYVTDSDCDLNAWQAGLACAGRSAT